MELIEKLFIQLNIPLDGSKGTPQQFVEVSYIQELLNVETNFNELIPLKRRMEIALAFQQEFIAKITEKVIGEKQ